MPTFSLRTASRKVSTAPCTIKPGHLSTQRITANGVDLTDTLCLNHTSTRIRRKQLFCFENYFSTLGKALPAVMTGGNQIDTVR